MEKTNEATPRPWRNSKASVFIEREFDNNLWVAECRTYEDAELIVKAVNAYDSLVEEVRRLKSDTEERIEAASLSNKDKRYLADRIIELQNENQKLREALTEIRNDLDDVGAYDGTISRDTRDKLDTILETKAKNVYLYFSIIFKV